MIRKIVLFAAMKNKHRSAPQSRHHRGEVAPKKHLGQHFLTDGRIAAGIVEALASKCTTQAVLEIGPGMGVLTSLLLKQEGFATYALDVDAESIEWLKKNLPALDDRLRLADFLHADVAAWIGRPFAVIGNFPYNISSQIVFRIIAMREQVPLMVGMFQKEVAERICAAPGTKACGILSILTQAYYDAEYLFTVDEHVFDPPPKVKSAVIRLTRRTTDFDVPEQKLKQVVKAAFNQRRKKLRNALHAFHVKDEILQAAGFADRRAEELSVTEFVKLTHLIGEHGEHRG